MMPQLNLFQWITAPILSVLGLQSLFVMARGTRWRGAGIRSALWFTAAVAVVRPEITIIIARTLGIGRGADLVLYLFIIGSIGTALYFYGRLVGLETAITALVRQSALRAIDEPDNEGSE